MRREELASEQNSIPIAAHGRRIVTPHDNSALDTLTNSIKIMGFDRIICR
jgi:hypothetical protein